MAEKEDSHRYEDPVTVDQLNTQYTGRSWFIKLTFMLIELTVVQSTF